MELKLQCKNKKDSLAGLHVSGISAPEGYAVTGFDLTDGSFVLKPQPGFLPGKIALNVSFSDTTRTLPLVLTVKTAPVVLKLSGSSISLNAGIGDSAAVRLTAAPADYRITAPSFRLTDSKGADKLASGELAIRYEDGSLRVSTTPATPGNAGYKLYISAGGSKEAVLTVKTLSGSPTVSLKTAGNIDLSFPDRKAAVVAAYRNYAGGTIRSYEYSIAEMKGKTVLDEDAARFFTLDWDGGTVFHIGCRNTSAINTGSSYLLRLRLTLPDGSSCENTVKLNIKRTDIKLKLSASKISLNRSIPDRATVNISCTTAGYPFTQPLWELMDSTGKFSAKGKLDISYADGTLTVAVNSETEYGASYKLLIRPEAGAKPVTLVVSVPQEVKSTITNTLKLSGSVDVIRDHTAVVVTPNYKNCAAGAVREEELVIYSSGDLFTEPVNDLFRVSRDSQGSFQLTKAPGAVLDHSLKYKLKMVTVFENGVTVESAPVLLSVKMGSAKVTVKSSSTVLFAKDKNSRVNFCIATQDSGLNGVARVEIKDAKYRQLFEIFDYGNGQFAVGFRNGIVDSSLIPKTGTKSISLSLQVYLEGNTGTKSNAAVTLKFGVTQ